MLDWESTFFSERQIPFIVTNFAGILNVNISVIADAVMVLMDCNEIFTSEIIKFSPLDCDSFIFDKGIAEYTCTSADSVRVTINNNKRVLSSREAAET